MNRVLLSLALAGTLFAAPALADNQSRILKLLNDAGLEYQLLDDGTFKMLIEFTDNRSQLVFLFPMEPLSDVEIVEVYSPVMRVDEPMPTALANRLLRVTGDRKLGYFGVEDVQGDSATVFCYHNMPLEALDGDVLLLVVRTVAEIADEMEKEQLGAASDEF